MKRAGNGFALLDAIVATALLAVLLTVSVKWITSMSTARRAIDERAIALQLAANAIERASAIAWPELTDGRLAELSSQAAIDQQLPGAALSLTLQPGDDDPAAKHVRAEISWNDSARPPQAPVRLNYWAFAPGGGGQ